MENMSEESAGEGETSQVKQQCSAYLSGYRVPAVCILVVVQYCSYYYCQNILSVRTSCFR